MSKALTPQPQQLILYFRLQPTIKGTHKWKGISLLRKIRHSYKFVISNIKCHLVLCDNIPTETSNLEEAKSKNSEQVNKAFANSVLRLGGGETKCVRKFSVANGCRVQSPAPVTMARVIALATVLGRNIVS